MRHQGVDIGLSERWGCKNHRRGWGRRVGWGIVCGGSGGGADGGVGDAGWNGSASLVRRVRATAGGGA